MKGGLSLGIGVSGLVSSSPRAAMSEATFWGLVGAGNIQPDEVDDFYKSDYNAAWDLDSDNDFMPEAKPTSAGYWQVTLFDTGDYDMYPRNV